MMLFMGSYLIVGRIADNLVGSVYERSRKMIGIGAVILGFEYLMFSLFNLRLELPHYAAALSLSVLSIVCDLFVMAVFPMLDDATMWSPKRVWQEIIYNFIFIFSVWGVVLSCNNLDYTYIVLGFGLLAFLGKVCYWVHAFFRLYNQAKRRAANYFSDCEDGAIEWLPNSMYFVVILCLTCGFVVFAPLWIIMVYIVYVCFVFFYIFSGVMNMMLNKDLATYLCEISRSSELDDAEGVMDDNGGDDDGATCNRSSYLRSDLIIQLDRRLKHWVEEEGYLESDITIKSLSVKMNTNRTYLSNYINAIYGCSFRDWVADLRLSEAKRILATEEGITLAELAVKVGFTSSTSFSRAFSRVEGISPNRWRELNVNQQFEQKE